MYIGQHKLHKGMSKIPKDELLKAPAHLLVIYLHCRGVDISHICAQIASIGHLDALKYARANDYPWNDDVFIQAAYARNSHIIEYAHANGCTCRENTYNKIARIRAGDIRRNAYNQGFIWDMIGANAGKKGNKCMRKAKQLFNNIVMTGFISAVSIATFEYCKMNLNV